MDHLLNSRSCTTLKLLRNSTIVRNDATTLAELFLLFEKDKTLWQSSIGINETHAMMIPG